MPRDIGDVHCAQAGGETIGVIACLFATKKTVEKTGVTCIQWLGRYANGNIHVHESNGVSRQKKRTTASFLADINELLLERGIDGKIKVFRTPTGTLNFNSVRACLNAREKIPW